MKPIIVIGGGGHAKVVISIIKRLPDFKIIGYLDVKDKGPLLGIPYLGQDSELLNLKKKYPDCEATLGIGNIEISDKRKKLSEYLLSLGFSLPVLISPQAIVNEEVSIGAGTVIVDGAVINSGTTIGQCTIINTSSSIDHDCTVGDFAHIAPGVVLCGGVKIGLHSFVGARAVVIQNKTVGAYCFIGAGGVVTKDCKAIGYYVGIPAKKIKKRCFNKVNLT